MARRGQGSDPLIWVALLLLGGLAWFALRPAPPAPAKPASPAATPAPTPSTPVPTAQATEVPKARLALVIDDWGYQKVPVDRIPSLGFTMTVSVLPNLPFSKAAAEAGHAAGDEVILHCPMQSVKPVGRERNTLLVTMDAAQARAALETDWASVPFADGMNNHEGSKASADRKLMDVAAAFLKERGCFFLDSVTTAHSAIPAAAKAAGIPWARRRVFLDNSEAPAAIERQLDDAVRVALKDGQCIAIGHPHKTTLDVLRRLAPALAAKGVVLVKVSELTHP
jgi:hypothetical protein